MSIIKSTLVSSRLVVLIRLYSIVAHALIIVPMPSAI